MPLSEVAHQNFIVATISEHPHIHTHMCIQRMPSMQSGTVLASHKSAAKGHRTEYNSLQYGRKHMVILVTDSSWKNFQRSIQGLEKRSSYVWWDFEKTTLAAGREWVIKVDQKLIRRVAWHPSPWSSFTYCDLHPPSIHFPLLQMEDDNNYTPFSLGFKIEYDIISKMPFIIKLAIVLCTLRKEHLAN